jgi:class 3 adenylate cyclase
MRTDLPTGTVTFLFTDVEGSTRLLHELGAERYAEALAEHRRRVDCVFRTRTSALQESGNRSAVERVDTSKAA